MKQYKRPFLIAITGSFASGKTLVSKWFEEKGFTVHYTDKLGHAILQDEKVIYILAEKFGNEILENGAISRTKLGKIVFDSTENLKFLNIILHPQIRSKTQVIIDSSREDYLVFEIPLLCENKLQDAFDLTINISTSKKNQISRGQKRDKMKIAQIEQRIKSQMSAYDKQKLADINIENNGTIDELYLKLENLLPLIKRMCKKDIRKIIEL
jgi:dephospho-CoA kinase